MSVTPSMKVSRNRRHDHHRAGQATRQHLSRREETSESPLWPLRMAVFSGVEDCFSGSLRGAAEDLARHQAAPPGSQLPPDSPRQLARLIGDVHPGAESPHPRRARNQERFKAGRLSEARG
jgi:hypothetical protein